MRKSHWASTKSFCSIPFNDSHGLRINLKAPELEPFLVQTMASSFGYCLEESVKKKEAENPVAYSKTWCHGFRSFSFDILLLVFL